ncbi:MAG: patatin-like phospholipase family protein [Oceanococcus sp.]
MGSSLILRAGPTARNLIQKEGIKPEHFSVVAGAAGGPKWLSLGSLDRYLFGEFFKDRQEPLHTVGSSIATWRFAAAAQDDPVAAIDRFEQAYLKQSYSDKPDAAEISYVCQQLLDDLLPDAHMQQLLNHRYLRPHIIAVRCLGKSAQETPRQLKAGLARIVVSNMRGRHRMAKHLQRVVFRPATTSPDQRAPFLPFQDQFLSHEVDLSADNLKPALRASASIPLLMQGEENIPGAPAGMYRDGGLIDYHMDLHYRSDPKLVLFPHFSTRIVPGWLDKFLPWRKPHAHHLDQVLMIAPSDEMLARLPNGKIPDRKDFSRYKDMDSLLHDWTVATQECRRIADEWAELVEKDLVGSRVEAFPQDSVRLSAAS